MPDARRQRGGPRKRRSHTTGGSQHDRILRRRVIMMWSGVLVLITAIIMVVAMWLWLTQGMQEDEAAARGNSRPPKLVVERLASPTQEAAVDLVKRALMIRDRDKVEKYFRIGSTSPAEVVVFLRGMEAVDGKITGYDWQSSMDANGLAIDCVSVHNRLGDNTHSRLAMLTPDDKGQWKLDFEAFARTVKPAWDELLTMTSVKGLVRVVVRPDNYFNGPFQNESLWQCYGMASPDTTVIMSGYCLRGSPQARAMEQLVANDHKSATAGGAPRATLEVRRTPGAASRQFEITRVLAEDWVLAATPFDEQFK